MSEPHDAAVVTPRKLALFVALALIGTILITASLLSIHVEEHGVYRNISIVFSEKVCREQLIERVYEGEFLKKVFHNETPHVACSMLSLNDPGVRRKQVLAAVIFYVSLLAAIMFWERRVAAVFIGVAALVFTGVVPFRFALESMELHLVLFLIGMMIVVGYLKETGLLRFISAKIIAYSGAEPKRFLLLLMLLAFTLAALVDEVSSIVYVTLLILEVSEILGLNPVPWLIVSVFATNAGSAATMIGNPIGIYIGLYFKKTFGDFVFYATPAAIAAVLVTYPIAALFLEKTGEFEKMRRAARERLELDPWAEVRNIKDFYLSAVIFVLTILGIAFHVEIAHAINAVLEAVYGPHHIYRVGSEAALVLVPLIAAGVVLARAGVNARRLVEERVEWWALVFFMFLFSLAAGLSVTGVTDLLAYLILVAVGGGVSPLTGYLANLLMMVTSAITSGFIDNMPIIVALSPVAKTLMSIGLQGSEMLPWSLLFGGTLGGNLTIIGSTANIVAVGIAEKRGFRIGFREWIKIGAVVVTVTLVAAAVWIALFIFGIL